MTKAYEKHKMREKGIQQKERLEEKAWISTSWR
jgi:hypothetical protein